MRDEGTEIAKAELFDGVVRYSRIDRHGSDDPEERGSPMFVGVEVPEIREADSRKFQEAPDVRPPAEGRGRGRRRPAFGVFFGFAIFAFLAGIGVLAGSFYYLTVAKVKRPVVASDSTTAVAFLPVSGAAQTLSGGAPTEPSTAAPGNGPEPGDEKAASTPDFSAASEPESRLIVSVDPAEKPAVADAPAEKAPVPRTRPQADDAADAVSEAAKPTVPSNTAPEVANSGAEEGPTVVEADPAPVELRTAPDLSTEAAPASPSDQTIGLAAPEQAAGDPVSIVPDTGEAAPVPPADIPEAPAAIAALPDEQPAAIIPPEPADGSIDGQNGAEAVFPRPEDAQEVPTAAPDASGEVASEDANDPYQSALDNWRVLSVRGGVAVIDGRERGVFMVQRGSEIPGVGIVEAIKKRNGRWTVVTSVGFIVSAVADDRWRPLKFLERRRYLTR